MEETLNTIEDEEIKNNSNFSLNKVLKEPLVLNKYFMKITLLLHGFILKMEENIDDEI